VSVLKTRFAARAAKALRANSTDSERLLWSRLRDRRLLGFKFVRQQPVGPFIADFACRDADLIIELDGGQHTEDQALAADERRSALLGTHGYRVIRFWNSDVRHNIDGVIQSIAAELERAPSPGLRFAKSDLSPEGEVAGQTAEQGMQP
jgi:very-short-patch-repair endonuclease